jgi:hypothetical protein
MADDIKATYTGDGTSVWMGVPMRDLTSAEWDALDNATQEALVKQGLFKLAAKKTAKKQESDA